MVSGSGALLLTLIFSGWGAFAALAPHWQAVLALGVFATALPVTFFMRLIRAAGPTRAAMTGYLVPAVAAVMGVLVLGETLELRQIIGGCIILAGVFLVSTAPAGGRAR
jgi:drug/metabolite transporter (DMT)-like permease